MGDLSSLGDLVIQVGGDISPLETALNSIPEVAQRAFQGVDDGFADLSRAAEASAGALQRTGEAANAMAGDMANPATAASGLNERLQALYGQGLTTSEALAALGLSLDKLGNSSSQTQAAAESATPKVKELGDAAGDAGKKAEESGISFKQLAEGFAALVGIEIGIKALKDFAESAVGTYAEIEKTTIALTHFSGSVEFATNTVEGLKIQALDQALSFPQLLEANQKVMALGFSSRQAAESLHAAADAAAAVGLNFAQVAPNMDRMAQSGNLVARQLATIGLTLQDVAKAAHATVAELQGPGNIFKAMDPGERMDLLIASLNKYRGTAEEMAHSLVGQFQNLKTETILSLSGIGEAVAPMLKDVMSSAQQSLIPALETLVQAFKDLGAVLGPLLTGTVTQAIQLFGDLGTVLGKVGSMVADDIAPLGLLGSKFDGTKESARSLWDVIRDVSPWGAMTNAMHMAATEVQLATANTDMLTRATLIMHAAAQGTIKLMADGSVQIGGVTGKLKDLIDQTSKKEPLMAIRLEFENWGETLQSAKIHLENVTAAYEQGMASAGMVAKAQAEYNDILYKMDPAAKAAAQASKNLASEMAKLETNVKSLLDTLPKTVTDFEKLMDEGGKRTVASFSAIQKEIDATVVQMAKFGDQVPNSLLRLYGALKQAQDQMHALASAAETDLAVSLEHLDNSAEVAAAKTEALTIKEEAEAAALAHAEQALISIVAAYNKHNASADQVQAALNAVSAATQKAKPVLEQYALAHQAAAFNSRVLTTDTDQVKTVIQNLGDATPGVVSKIHGLGTEEENVKTHIANMGEAAKDVVDPALKNLAKAHDDAATAAGHHSGKEDDLTIALGKLKFVCMDDAAAIEVISGSNKNAAATAAAAALGIQVLTGSVGTHSDSLKHAKKDVEDLASSWSIMHGVFDTSIIKINAVNATFQASLAAEKAAIAQFGDFLHRTMDDWGNAITAWGTSITESLGKGGTVSFMGQSFTSPGGGHIGPAPAKTATLPPISVPTATPSPVIVDALTNSIQAVATAAAAAADALQRIANLWSGGTTSVASSTSAVSTAMSTLSASVTAAGQTVDTNFSKLLNDAARGLTSTLDQAALATARSIGEQTDFNNMLATAAQNTLTSDELAIVGLTLLATATGTAAASINTLTAATLTAAAALASGPGPSNTGGLTPSPAAVPALGGSGPSGTNSGGLIPFPTAQGNQPFGGLNINITVQAGVVAGANGMSQLAGMIQNQMIATLRQTVGLKI